MNPVLVLFAGAFFFYVFKLFLGSPETTVLLLSFLIFSLTLIQYIVNKKYAESSLSFMLGMLTVFTIEWNDYRALIFIIFYVSLNVFMFLIASVRISSEVEIYLTDAAYLLDPVNTKQKAAELSKMIKEADTNGRLSLTDKAIATYHLLYFNVEERELAKAMQDIEIIKVIYRLTLDHSIELYKAIYQMTSYSGTSVRNVLDIIHYRRFTFLPSELKDIIIATRHVAKEMEIYQYFDLIKKYNRDYRTKEEAIEMLKAVV